MHAYGTALPSSASAMQGQTAYKAGLTEFGLHVHDQLKASLTHT
jgi:hypothetical protein